MRGRAPERGGFSGLVERCSRAAGRVAPSGSIGERAARRRGCSVCGVADGATAAPAVGLGAESATSAAIGGRIRPLSRVGVALLLMCCSVACLRRRLCVRQSFVLVLPAEWIWQSVKEDLGWGSSDWCSLVVLRRKTMSVMFCLKKEFQPPDKWGRRILYRRARAASVVRNSLLLLPCRHCRCQSSRDT